MGRLFKSILVGASSTIAACVVAFALAPWFDAIGLLITPAAILIPIVGSIVPSTAIDLLVPSAGPAAGVLLILSCTLLFWAVIFGGVYFTLATILGGLIPHQKRRGARPSLRTR